MMELLDKLVSNLIGQANSGLVPWLLIAIGYFAWQNYNSNKAHKEEIQQYRETLEKLQLTLSQKTGEERATLLSIIEKYHQSQISIREAITEVKAVLSTISALGQRGM